MFLIVGKVGYYMGLSMEAVQEHSNALRMGPGDVIWCRDLKDAKRCLEAYGGVGAGDDLIVEKVVYWPRYAIQVICDLQTGTSYRCYEDGQVRVCTKDGSSYTYKICQGALCDSKKTVGLLKKHGELLFYNFDEGKIMKLTASHELYEKDQTDWRWNKCPGR